MKKSKIIFKSTQGRNREMRIVAIPGNSVRRFGG
jgi:hypothetical protein